MFSRRRFDDEGLLRIYLYAIICIARLKKNSILHKNILVTPGDRRRRYFYAFTSLVNWFQAHQLSSDAHHVVYILENNEVSELIFFET